MAGYVPSFFRCSDDFQEWGPWYGLRGCEVSGEAISGAPSRSLDNRNNDLATCSGCAPSTYVSHTRRPHTVVWPPSHPCCSQQHLAWAQILCPISCSKVGRAGLIGFTWPRSRWFHEARSAQVCWPWEMGEGGAGPQLHGFCVFLTVSPFPSFIWQMKGLAKVCPNLTFQEFIIIIVWLHISSSKMTRHILARSFQVVLFTSQGSVAGNRNHSILSRKGFDTGNQRFKQNSWEGWRSGLQEWLPEQDPRIAANWHNHEGDELGGCY